MRSGGPSWRLTTARAASTRRVANADFVRGILIEWTRAHSTREIVEAIGGKVPVGPVNTAKDIFDDPHPRARDDAGRG